MSHSDSSSDSDNSRWLNKDDIQNIAKLGGDFLKKTMVSGMETFKDLKDTLPKESAQLAQTLISKGKEELKKGFSQEVAKSILGFTLESFFQLARAHRLEFSIRIRHNDEESQEKSDTCYETQASKKRSSGTRSTR